jgi:hypothetical protein
MEVNLEEVPTSEVPDDSKVNRKDNGMWSGFPLKEINSLLNSLPVVAC